LTCSGALTIEHDCSLTHRRVSAPPAPRPADSLNAFADRAMLQESHLARMRGPLHYTRKFQKAGATKLILDKPALMILAADD
jgi:hypothetical protein